MLSRIEKNNPLLQSYQHKISATNELAKGAKAWMPPMAGIEFDQNPYSFHHFYMGMIRTSVMQEFPNRKVLNAKVDYLKSFSDVNLKESLYQRNKFFSEAKSAYYGIYISQKTIQITKESIVTMKSMIELAEKQMASGMGDMASIFKLKARLADKETMLVHDENMIKAYMVTLNYLMNSELNQTFSIDSSGIIKDYKNLFTAFTKDSIEQKRSDIMQMNSKITSMKLNQNIVSLNLKPTFGAKFEHFQMMDKPNMFSIMATIKIPIAPWSSKEFKSDIKSMEFEIDAMQQEKQNMINMTSQMIKMLEIEMNSEYQEIENYSQKVIPAYKKSFDVYLLAYGQTTSDLMLVLLAFDDLQMAQMEYIKHIGLLLKVQVDYEKELQIR